MNTDNEFNKSAFINRYKYLLKEGYTKRNACVCGMMWACHTTEAYRAKVWKAMKTWNKEDLDSLQAYK